MAAFVRYKDFTIWTAGAAPPVETTYSLNYDSDQLEYLSQNGGSNWTNNASQHQTSTSGDYVRIQYTRGITYTVPQDATATALVSIIIDGVQTDANISPGQLFVNEQTGSGSHTLRSS
ncbi:MAG: hypothetical protein EOO63_01195, partial [Hymenobacter sp.]